METLGLGGMATAASPAVTRIVGAGISTPPLDPFVAALVAFGEAVGAGR